jgi:hypothetical protein
MELLTHSRLSCARSCLRRHLLRYELGLRPEEDAEPLQLGTLYHRMHELNSADACAALATQCPDPFRGMLAHALWAHHPLCTHKPQFEVLAHEVQFEFPLRNPDTAGTSRTFMVAGKIDKIIRLSDGRIAVLEHKTTASDIGPGSDYWLRVRMDQQVTLYLHGARAAGFDATTIVYDVAKKPSQRPYKATPHESRKYTKDGRLYANQREFDEQPAEYYDRIAAELADHQSEYYAAHEIARMQTDLDLCDREIWQQAQTIMSARAKSAWYRNPDACTGRARCEYLDVCSLDLEHGVVPSGFRKVDNVHPELHFASEG